MSGLLSSLPALRDFLGLSGLKPGSFRGVPFHVQDTDLASGRRVVVHEFPLRDETQTEDLGRKPREVGITAYVVGDNWQDRRDDLLSACEDSDKPGTLTLPGGFEMLARCVTVRVSETGQARRVATFTLTFAEAGEDEPAIKKTLDTAALVRSRLGGVLTQAREAFAIGYAVAGRGDFVRTLAVAELANIGNAMAARWLGLPGLNLAGVVRAVGLVRTADPAAPADAVLAPSRALADAALATDLRALPRTDGASETSRAALLAPRRDVAVALLDRANAPPLVPLPVVGVISARAEANRVALDALDRDAAALTAAEVLASMEFGSIAEARALRDALLTALEARAEAAAVAKRDEAFRAWRDLAAVSARDLAERARRAPLLAPYSLGARLPSLVVAQRLYQTGAQSDALVSLNDPPHPAFMPARGSYLQ
jgi:prophage DNA circulation protein